MGDEAQIFQFPYNTYLKVRLEFVLLRDDDLQARIMRIIEGWMADQKKAWESAVVDAVSNGLPEPPEPEYWCTLSYAQIIAQLYKFNTSRGSRNKDKPNGKEVIEGKENNITRATVGAAMQALISDAYVLIRPNPNKTKTFDASQYKLNVPLIQEHLTHLPHKPMSYLGSNGRIEGVPCKNFLHPPLEIASHIGFTPCTKNVHGDVQKTYMGCTKILHGDVKNSYILIDKVIDYSNTKNKENTSVVSSQSSENDDTHALSSIQSLIDQLGGVENVQNALAQLLAQQQSQQQPSETTQNAIPDQQHTPTMPYTDQSGIIAQPTQQSPRIAASDPVEAMPQKPNTEQASSVSYSPVAQAKSEDMVPVVPSPAKPTKPRTKKAAPPSLPAFDDVDRAEIDRQIAEEKAKEEERKEKHRTVYAKIVARRGRELEKGKIAFERTYINKLLENWTPEQIDRFHQYLMEEDWRWSKIDNKYRITAKTIYDEAGSIDLTLNDAAYKSPNQTQKKEEPKNESDRATRLVQLRDQVMQAENPVKKAQDLFKSEKGHAENDAIRKALKDVLALQKDRQVVQTA